jgi:protein-disulfide isomerase
MKKSVPAIPLVAAFLLAATAFASAQTIVPANADRRAGFPFQNTSILKPPAGARVAIFEFEDMECPVCAADSPIVRSAVAQYKLPYIRRDFPLTEIHVWSFDAAVTARYIQDKISPALAETFRHDVFVNQPSIASKDDLARFTQRWFQAHHQSLPFVMDASGACKNEVQADRAIGDHLGIHGTPCIFVVTQKRWVQVADMSQLYHTIDVALAETNQPTAPADRRKPQPIHP